jgi:hypothetical protein
LRRLRALRSVQRRLERFYGLESAPDVSLFVRIGGPHQRETLLLRQSEEELEIALVLPPLPEPGPDGVISAGADDTWLQMIEGVSHFLYVAERARTNLPATQLELELQAEVDKFVLLALSRRRIEPSDASMLHGRLYENVTFLHPPDSEAGERYRLANDLAARFTARLMNREKPSTRVRVLRRFYRSGQTEKIRLVQAA